MKRFFLYMLPFLFLAACSTEPVKETTVDADTNTASPEQPLEIDIQKGTELAYENLQIFPVVADASFFEGNEAAASMKNLREGIDTKGFYVTEKKPYGRRDDMNAVNSLTVQNKSDFPVYLMQGDVVTGGNQDRIIAEDQVIAARTISDIPVYCVEEGRWSYRAEEAAKTDAESKYKKEIFAFSGYYNVAANDLRRTVRNEKNQKAVWNKVGEFTSKHNATTSTSTYAGLEGSSEFATQRDAYVAFFTDKLKEIENCVGFVAVSGNEIIGKDIFGHPNLFKKQAEGLLNGYVTDAITNGAPVTITAKRMVKETKKLNRAYNSAAKGANSDEIFKHNDVMIHFSEL